MGYAGAQIARIALAGGARVMATVRQHSIRPCVPGVEIFSFDDPAPYRAVTNLVVTAPPDAKGDPVWAAHAETLQQSPELRWVGYVSTTGVYGDRNGGWVDEATLPAPGQDRSRRRLAAEEQWKRLAGRAAVALLRTGGIYGPGRSAIDDVVAGTARSVAKPGHAFSRIHRDDIARAVVAAANRDARIGTQVLHLVDDEPAEASAVVTYAAQLLGAAPPPVTPFEAAAGTMSDMARSFWSENRRVCNLKTKAYLGMEWGFPTYREGLRAILAEKRTQDTAQQIEVRRR